MKNSNIFLSGFVVMSLFLSSCAEGLEDLDGNPRNVTQEQLEVDFQNVGSLYKPMFENIYQYTPPWSFQLQQNLNADVFSGYMTNPRPFVAGANNTTYNLVSGWNNFIWSVPYSNVMNNAKTVENETRETFPELFAVSQILKITAMHK